MLNIKNYMMYLGNEDFPVSMCVLYWTADDWCIQERKFCYTREICTCFDIVCMYMQSMTSHDIIVA